jgi:hypothetical protein
MKFIFSNWTTTAAWVLGENPCRNTVRAWPFREEPGCLQNEPGVSRSLRFFFAKSGCERDQILRGRQTRQRSHLGMFWNLQVIEKFHGKRASSLHSCSLKSPFRDSTPNRQRRAQFEVPSGQ